MLLAAETLMSRPAVQFPLFLQQLCNDLMQILVLPRSPPACIDRANLSIQRGKGSRPRLLSQHRCNTRLVCEITTQHAACSIQLAGIGTFRAEGFAQRRRLKRNRRYGTCFLIGVHCKRCKFAAFRVGARVTREAVREAADGPTPSKSSFKSALSTQPCC